MKMKLLIISLLLFACTLNGKEPFLFGQQTDFNINVNNRILAVVNGKPISVIDVMKKMDMLFYNQFPEYTDSVQARYQFYQMNWKQALQELIDKELIIADAIEKKLPVTSGDVRQEMEKLFGPNIIVNLDKIGMNYEEASEIVKGDLIIRRMMYYSANAKALRQVTPRHVREAYEEYSQKNMRPDGWRYHVISIRGEDSTESAEVANYIHQLVAVNKISLEELQKQLDEQILLGKNVTANISQEYHHTEKEVAENYKHILSKMKPDTYNQPIAQKSRSNNSMVFRIFYLDEKIPGGVVPFYEAEKKLKNMLLDKAIEEESLRYIAKLRHHYKVEESYLSKMIPDDFQPFTLQ